MTIQFFAPRNSDGSLIRLPSEYRRQVKWLPQIGDAFPNIVAETTKGTINLETWADGDWTFLFSHPAAHTPVCTTEIGALAGAKDAFRALGVKALGLTGSSVSEQLAWYDDVEDLFGADIWFPSIADPKGKLATTFGMRHAKEDENQPIRKSFLLDPNMRIRMIFEYPVHIGRSVEETLRVIEALQLQDRTGCATPCDWTDGDPVIVPANVPDETVREEFGTGPEKVLPYFRVVDSASQDDEAGKGIAC